jgi:glycosyltransferase involved in cell wall biosynthesis
VTKEPLFSVIVTTYNRPGFLVGALESVRRQTVEDFECLVVNDGGDPVEVPQDDRLRLIEKENGGFASAVNAGLAEARGRYVAFLDDDDEFVANRLELGVKGMAHAPLSFCWRAKIDTGVGRYDRLLNGWVHDEILDRGTPLMGQATVLRDRVLKLNEALTNGSDADWMLRSTKEMQVSTVPEVGFLFRQDHPTRKSHDLTSRLAARELFYELHKDYFKTHRKAAARFHGRTGLFISAAGDAERARHHLWRAVVLRPTPRMVFRWARALLPSGAQKKHSAGISPSGRKPDR